MLDSAALAQADVAARWLASHPDARVNLAGHTDPVGREDYNQVLGADRAEAIAAVLRAHADPRQITTRSVGEHELATADPRAYRLDRRVTMVWRSAPTPFPSTAWTRAQAELDSEIPAPYNNVLQYIPHPGHSANPALENWHWGSMPPSFAAQIDFWIRGYEGPS